MGKYRVLGSLLDRVFRNNLNANFDDVDADIQAQKKRVDDLIIANPSPSEVQDARLGFPVLRDKLVDVDAQLAQNLTNLDGRGINVLYPPAPLSPCAGDGITDDTTNFNAIYQHAKNNKKSLIIPETNASYRLSKFQGIEGVDVIGIGKPKIDLFNNVGVSVVPLLGLSNKSTYENIYFNCLEVDLEWNRGDLTGRTDVNLKNCKFEGFRDEPGAPNAWGLYLDESKNITIDNCEFENNSQSDIAIVEGCKNITIINAKGSSLHLNLEPNGLLPSIENIKVIGGNFAIVSLLENGLEGVCVQNISFMNCTIDDLYYNGSSADFINTKIKKITPPNMTRYAGMVKFNGSVTFGKNLLPDPYLMSASSKSLNSNLSNWGMYSNIGGAYDNYKHPLYGRVFRLNPSQLTNCQVTATIKDKVNCNANSLIAVVMTSKGYYPAGSSWISRQGTISFYDNANNLISSENIHFNRGASGSESPFSTQIGIVKTPANAVTFSLQLFNSTTQSPNRVDISSISVHEVIPNQYGFTDYGELESIHGINKERIVLFPEVPKTNVLYPNYFLGDKFKVTPIAGGYEEYICTADGSPGTWKGVGQIQV